MSWVSKALGAFCLRLGDAGGRSTACGLEKSLCGNMSATVAVYDFDCLFWYALSSDA